LSLLKCFIAFCHFVFVALSTAFSELPKVEADEVPREQTNVVPSVVPVEVLKLNGNEVKQAFVQEPVAVVELNDEDAGLAARGELDDSETRRQMAGL
jgi:hypothetical protein